MGCGEGTKQRILSEYLAEWGHELGSLAQQQSIKLWYVDCFAGPWQSRSDALEDTSIYIGLTELRKAAESWQSRGYDIRVGAIFVENTPEHSNSYDDTEAVGQASLFSAEAAAPDMDIRYAEMREERVTRRSATSWICRGLDPADQP